MNKEDLIYQKICDVEQMVKDELAPIKKDVCTLMGWRNQILGAWIILASAFWFMVEQFKK